MDVGNLICGSSAFSKTSLNTWKFMVHVLLKPGLENFEDYFTSVWDECNYAVVWAFFGIAFLWDWNENWPVPVMSNSALPHRRQPTRLPCPWDSPGKNAGVGCHFLLQCMKVKSESESHVRKWCCIVLNCVWLFGDPLGCSPPGSCVHRVFQARILVWVVISFSRGSSQHRDQTRVSCITGGLFNPEPPGKTAYRVWTLILWTQAVSFVLWRWLTCPASCPALHQFNTHILV